MKRETIFYGQFIGDTNIIYVKDGSSVKNRRKAYFICYCGEAFLCDVSSIKSGNTKSRGCRNIQSLIERNTKHGSSCRVNTTPEYKTWAVMKSRCYNPNTDRYPNYGGRGIRICDRWLNSFDNFLEDMGPKPSSKHSIDRIDVNADYTPENCKWSTPEEQASNKTSNVHITAKGVTKTIAEWSRYTGVKYSTLYQKNYRTNTLIKFLENII